MSQVSATGLHRGRQGQGHAGRGGCWGIFSLIFGANALVEFAFVVRPGKSCVSILLVSDFNFVCSVFIAYCCCKAPTATATLTTATAALAAAATSIGGIFTKAAAVASLLIHFAAAATASAPQQLF